MKKLTTFLIKNWSGIILGMIVALFMFFSVGYFAEVLFHVDFDLNSIWVGVGAVSAGGVTGMAKYFIDSK